MKRIAFATIIALIVAAFAPTTCVFADDEGTISDILNVSGEGMFPTSDRSADSAVEKEETVYVITKADGSKKDVIVSDHLINNDSAKTIKDRSDLKDIENIKGSEKFSRETKNVLNWAAGGKDIYYQGRTDRSLPVNLVIKYFLDDEEITGKNIQGKSGEVRILIKYRNHTKVPVTVDGNIYEVCVPFVAMTGMILENEHFSNVKVSNGKVVNDGERQIVVGTALPGVSDSLDLSGLPELPGEVEITADAKDFSLDYMMSVVTSSVFDSIDFSMFDTNSIGAGVSSLNNAAGQLVNGSDSLVRGLNKLYSSSGKMKGALNKLVNGAEEVRKGAETASKGAGKLAEGAGNFTDKTTKLSEGLSSLSSGTSNLNSGAKTVYNAVKNEMKPSVEKLAEGAVALDGGIDQISDAMDQISDADMQALKYIRASLANPLITGKTKQALEGACQYLEGSLEGQNKLKSQFSDSGTEGTIKNGTSALNEGLSQLDKVIGKAGQKGTLANSVKEIADGAASLTSYADLAAKGSSELSEGADKLATSSEELVERKEKLQEGAEELSGGASVLSGKVPQLVSGLSKLASGSEKLSSGMRQLYQQGIKKLMNVYNSTKGAADKIKAMSFAAKGYNTFTKLTRGTSGSVKFIYKTDPSEGAAKDE